MLGYTPYRYPVKLSKDLVAGRETKVLMLPAGAMFLSVAYTPWRPDEIQLYYMVDVKASFGKRVEIMVLGTGHGRASEDTMKKLAFRGTVITNDEEVYHVFEVKKLLPPLKYKGG